MIYLFLSIALACAPQDKFKIKCEDYCWIDQKVKESFVKNNKCYCGVEVDLEKELLFVPKNGGIFREKRKVIHYSVESE
jgi:hypothetical protein